jgi:tRNA-dihydrouridine synthase
VKDAVGVPVIANGDLAAPGDLPRMLELSGADGVMVGRGAYGAPWLPGAMAADAAGSAFNAPAGPALHALVVDHYAAILEHYGGAVGLKAARKHLGWYMAEAGTPGALRHAVMTETSPAVVMRLLADAFGAAEERRAA